MFLKATIGRYAGEIREYSPEAAQALLRSGRAINPYASAKAAAPEAAEAEPKPQGARERRGRNKHGRN
jgi:hypothetical protein